MEFSRLTFDETRRLPRIHLLVPGSEMFLEVIRSVVGRAARVMGFSYDGIEDLALAADEAAVLLLGVSPLEMTVSIEDVAPGNDRLTITLAIESGDWPPIGLEGDTRWHILEALCEKVWVLTGEVGGIGLSQSVR